MRQKTVWIWNHYATNTFFDTGGRHYWFAKYLKEKGFNVKIFCASTLHNSDAVVDTGDSWFTLKSVNGIEYVFLKVSPYKGNGLSRIKNMRDFYKNLFRTYKNFESPDVIIASSVHPLTLVAGIKISKKLSIPCICEIRDLWPESLIEYNKIKRKSMIAKCMQSGEKWIYKKADSLIFTIPGAFSYICDMKWESEIPQAKVNYINNGVDLKTYSENVNSDRYTDSHLDAELFNVVYTGSIREANHIDRFVEVADKLDSIDRGIQILIYGDGDRKEKLEKIVEEKKLTNIKFLGKVEKSAVPCILHKSKLNIMDGDIEEIGKYGLSGNKLFEYAASGKPVIMDCNENQFGFINNNHMGVAKKFDSPEEMAKAIADIKNLSEDSYDKMCKNALNFASEYDFQKLTDDLIKVIEQVTER